MRTLLFLILLTGPATAQSPQVVTDIAPVHSLVAQVTQGVTDPELLLAAGDDPHHLSLRPSQARALAQADIVIWVGPALTPWLAEALAERADPVLVLAPDLREDDDDPHQWLDPAYARQWLPVIAEALAKVDPENAALYYQNASAAQTRLADLALQALSILSAHREARLITAHDAWGHFASAFDIRIAAAIREDDHAAPGARHLQNLRDLVDAGDVDCVLSEGPETDTHVATVIGDSGTPSISLHPLGPEIQPGPEFYETLLLGAAEAIAGCVSQQR